MECIIHVLCDGPSTALRELASIIDSALPHIEATANIAHTLSIIPMKTTGVPLVDIWQPTCIYVRDQASSFRWLPTFFIPSSSLS